jgi:hypothetical protein
MPQPDFFERGLKIGGAYQEGQDANVDRGIKEQTAGDVSAIRQQQARGLRIGNDESEYQAGRSRKRDTDVANAFAGGDTPTGTPAAGAPTTPTLDDYGQPLAGTAPQAGAPAAPAAPTAGKGLDLDNKAKRYRALMHAYGASGEIAKANDFEAKADTAEQTAVFESGASQDPTGVSWDAIRKGITVNSKFVQIVKDEKGRDRLSVQDPSGNGKSIALSDQNKRTLMGAVMLMNKGYVSAAMGKFASVDTDLATAASVENELRLKATKQNTDVQHQESQDESARISANAHASQAATARMKQTFGPPVQLVDEKGEARVVQPVMVNGKVQYDEIQFPAGTHYPKQAPEVKIQRSPDGTGVATDSRGGILYRLEGDVPVPAEKDPWASKDGQKKQAEWQDKGIVRGTVTDAKGKLHWGYTSTDDPDSKPWSSPEEALKNKPAPDNKSKLPPTPGRGVQMEIANPFSPFIATTPHDPDAAAKGLARDQKARQPQGLLGL